SSHVVSATSRWFSIRTKTSYHRILSADASLACQLRLRVSRRPVDLSVASLFFEISKTCNATQANDKARMRSSNPPSAALSFCEWESLSNDFISSQNQGELISINWSLKKWMM